MVVKITSFYLPLNPPGLATPSSSAVGRLRRPKAGAATRRRSGGLGVYSINIEEFQAGWHFHPG